MSSLAKLTVRNFARTFTRSYSAPTEGSIPHAKQKYVPSSGTYPKGFSVSGVHVGVKPSNKSKPDIAFITSDRPANGAAVFTTNKFQAAPVQVSRKVLESRNGAGIRSVIINSGCANAVTGNGGVEDANKMAEAATAVLGETDASPSSLVMSTGVIGQRLPIDKILAGIPKANSALDSSHQAWMNTARAIMTTDTFPKLASTTFTLPSDASTTYSLAGMSKGAGMIHPNMATLLGILATDAPIAAPALHSLLTSAVGRSFNSISIDGDTSTNDTVAILANGAGAPSSVKPISDPASADYAAFAATLTSFAQHLAQLVVRDGEGATKFVQLSVRNASSYDDAHKIASSIARSPLVKTALYGKDANWGRILCAIGYTAGISDGAVVPEKTNVSFVPTANSATKDQGVLKLLVDGEPQTVDEARAARLLEDEDLEVVIDLGTGSEEATVWTCDFSHEYVTINGDYRT
ncbi:glutamate N-acetyltransferase/amino-acid acetyltransferase [Cyphellophora europaea CBS 101466]|uniref:Arginine biosynthesis bifunctional protein ArgJ, mitochondrial n=1 Tax=Cyphellophora europaea (strain CBS 101466) TaxID=1220924 RepID=W2RX78_CYPE1|nr:glutamate N-acetyltransferase/amino-acid acetyltransferase [Cyphellophora europaea CBS 101466]ETN40309.1 glutamate N-acetyltransferase/amino-acid acetyltransferase [Cyphellophora europaea CBS 101466]